MTTPLRSYIKNVHEYYRAGFIKTSNTKCRQPAQKWLKGRRGRVLTMEEIQHYQRIVVALVETGR